MTPDCPSFFVIYFMVMLYLAKFQNNDTAVYSPFFVKGTLFYDSYCDL